MLKLIRFLLRDILQIFMTSGTPNGSLVRLDLQKNYYNPTITYDWITLKQHYNFPNNVNVIFGYYGMNIFKVESFEEVHLFNQLPAFYSRCLRQNETKIFDIQLWDGLLQRNTLVKSTMLTLTLLNIFHTFYYIIFSYYIHCYFSYAETAFRLWTIPPTQCMSNYNLMWRQWT